MPLTVLTDSDVRQVLDRLTKKDILDFHKSLADALHSYSTAVEPEQSGCCAANQPGRISIKRKDATTLFMPATADDAFGVKTVTLAERDDSMDSALSSLSLSQTGSTSTRSESPARLSSTTSGSSNSTARKDSLASSVSSSSHQSTSNASILTAATPLEPESPTLTSPRGLITLFTPEGQPRALINASTLTAFRTALASTLLLKHRQTVHTVTVFGGGLQAFWHVYLTLILRGDEIHHLNVINRDFTRAQKLYIQMAQHRNPIINEVFLGGKLKPTILTPRHAEYSRLLKEQVRAADVIFCCTPSIQPLFPAGHLTHTEGRRKARYIVAIGSYKPHMQELPAEVLKQAVASPETHRRHGLHLHHRHAGEGGAVVVDTIEGALTESGEIIRSGISGQGLVELGELVMLKRSHWADKAKKEEEERERREKEGKEKHHEGGHGIAHLFHHNKTEPEHTSKHPDGGLKDWLERGNVIYKSVGMGLMDVTVGMHLVRMAESMGYGTTVVDF